MLHAVLFVSRLTSIRYLLTGVMLGFMLLSFLPTPLDAARGGGGKTEVLPVEKAAPAAVVIDTVGTEQELRKQLRAKNGVVELSAPNTRFSSAPTGSFGFIAPQVLGMALVTQSPDLVLERVQPVASAYEVHKLADGSGVLVGFVGPDLMPHLTSSQRPKNIRIGLYSNPSEKAPHIAAVPLVKLVVDRMPIRLDPKKTDGPVMLDMDLQGTANRKSVPGAQ